MAHRHSWSLGKQYESGFLNVGDEAKVYIPPKAEWLCHCGAMKIVEVTDLQLNDQEATTGSPLRRKGKEL